MIRRVIVCLIVLVIVGFLFQARWNTAKESRSKTADAVATSTVTNSEKQTSTNVTALPISSTPIHPLAASLGTTAFLPEKEPEIVLNLFNAWRRQTGSYPSAEDNRQLVKILQGNNLSHIRLFPDQHNRISSTGELMDGWGSPYFFHHISAQYIEIRSAGPDRTMYSADDIVLPNHP